MMEALPPYHYQSLDLSGPWIRLLTVQPRTSGSEIRCEIRHVRLPEASVPPGLPYTALSYTWGQPNTPCHTIVIENAKFKVRENLFDFLSSLGSNGIGNLWVDAICIDQSNSSERNHQVSEMRRIYENASRVIIWLGQACADKTWLINYLNSSKSDRENLPQIHKIYQTTADICNKQYWRRTWVIQEVLLARNIELACGSKRLPWKAWVDHVSNLATRSFNVEKNQDTLQRRKQRVRASRMYALSQSWFEWRESPQSIGHLVLRHLHSECLRLHDKVYGLLGLATDAEKIPVNYDSPIEDVLVRVLDTMWGTITKFEFSSFCKCFDVSPARLVLPCELDPSELFTSSTLAPGKFCEGLDLNNYSIIRPDKNSSFIAGPKAPLTEPVRVWYTDFSESCRVIHKGRGKSVHPEADICFCNRCRYLERGFDKALIPDNCGSVVSTVRLILLGFEMHVYFDSHLRYLATATTSKMWHGENITLFFDPVEMPLNKSGDTFVLNLSSRNILNLLAHQDLYHNPEKNAVKIVESIKWKPVREKNIARAIKDVLETPTWSKNAVNTADNMIWTPILPMPLLWNRHAAPWNGAVLPWYGQIRYQEDTGWSFCLPKT